MVVLLYVGCLPLSAATVVSLFLASFPKGAELYFRATLDCPEKQVSETFFNIYREEITGNKTNCFNLSKFHTIFFSSVSINLPSSHTCIKNVNKKKNK